MSVTASLEDILKLLKACAAGHDIRPTTHYFRVKYKGLVFPDLPTYQNVEIGHIRKMVRALGIDKACANAHIPGLFKITEIEPKPAPAPKQPPPPPKPKPRSN